MNNYPANYTKLIMQPEYRIILINSIIIYVSTVNTELEDM